MTGMSSFRKNLRPLATSVGRIDPKPFKFPDTEIAELSQAILVVLKGGRNNRMSESRILKVLGSEPSLTRAALMQLTFDREIDFFGPPERLIFWLPMGPRRCGPGGPLPPPKPPT